VLSQAVTIVGAASLSHILTEVLTITVTISSSQAVGVKPQPKILTASVNSLSRVLWV
jgi:hypothetical protein